ncbi:MAG: peptidylprolyl isomerase [Brevirhabdus sp.]
MGFLKTMVAAVAAVLAISGAVVAQNSPFSAAFTVNGRAVTYYEIDQRIKFMTLLRAPGDIEEQAVKALENERLQLGAADRFGLRVTEEQLAEGMEEFAKRANLSAKEFIKALEGQGIAAETFRDFVHAGLVWRFIVQGRFGPRAQVTENEVDRAMSLLTASGGARVLLSEIILPARNPQEQAASQELADRLSKTITSELAFARAARSHSASGSAGSGGKMPWVPLTNLPPALVPILLTLAPGEVTDPIPIPNAIALFQLRALEELDAPAPDVVSLEYATLPVSAGRGGDSKARTQAILDEADTCDDLYGIAKRKKLEGLERVVLPVADIPQDILLELASLDENEASTALTRSDGQATTLLMLCGRTTELAEGRREEVRISLINQRLESYAKNYLEDLRAEAIIIRE